MAKRLGAAQSELNYAETGAHDKVVVNGDSEEKAFEELVLATWLQIAPPTKSKT
ncbi:hypothetical protein HDU99_004544, partial [Rhizoclosmatium hyalinum]